MANTSVVVTLETTDTLELGGHTTKGAVLQRVVNLLNGLRAGSKRGKSAQVQYGGAPLMPAVAHVKLASCLADTHIEINGVPFIAIAGTVIAANNEFDIDGTDAADAVDLCRAINACTDARISGVVTAVNQLKEIITPASTRAGSIYFTLADGTKHTFIGAAATATLGQPTFDYQTSVALTTASIAAQVNAYAPFTNKIYAVDNTTTVEFRSLDGALFTLLGTATTLAETGGATVTLSAKQKGAGGNALTVKPGGVRANAIITAASVATSDTITVNGQAITGIVQRATATITPDAAVAGNTVTIGTTVFTAATGDIALNVSGSATFYVGANDADTCESLADQINGFAAFSGILTATASSTVVTMRMVNAGIAYNAYPLASTATRLAKSGTTFTDGLAVANNQFDTSLGTTDAQTATDIARCINASTTSAIVNNCFATADGATVTVWSKHAGTIGNAITIATSDAGTLAITGSVARLAGGTETSTGGAQASGTLTLTSWLDTETVAVNGVTITAHATVQANNQVAISGSNDADALALALAINNSTTAGLADVIATASTNVVTVKSRKGGLAGNNITLTSGQASVVANVSKLASGAPPTTVVFTNPTAATQSGAAERFSNGAGGAGTFVNFDL